jgi:small redox-active disulfide protein 2
MKSIKVLGMGCAKCVKLAETAKEAAEAMGVEYTLEKVTDIKAIMGYGVMVTPALVVDEKVIFAGKLPTVDEIKKALE